jgi:hypothetical protein
MTRAAWTLAIAALSVAPTAARAKPVELVSRVPYEPLVAKLKASGSPERIVHVQRAADLDALTSGRRYKFVVDRRGQLAVAPLPADAPANEYVHPILAGGAPVLTAGGIRVDRANGKVERIVVDQDSKAYCPPLDSLAEAIRALVAAGAPAALIQREDRPPQCVAR